MRTLIICILVAIAAPAYAQQPVADADGDGISDSADQCPNDPEDRDGFEDGDGCPEPDNDRDGIPDTRDKCPREPETPNGFADEDGCPDKVIESLKLPSTTPPAKSSVNYACHPGQPNFGSNSCKCPPGSTPAMNGNTAICKTTPATRIEPRRPEPPAVGKPVVTPTGYRCGSGGKLVVGKGCTCAADRIERRDADGVSVCDRRATGATAAPAPARDGTVTFKATPWATVSLDGNPLGTTPKVNVRVSAGKHQVVFTRGARSERRTIEVQPGGSSIVSVSLDD